MLLALLVHFLALISEDPRLVPSATKPSRQPEKWQRSYEHPLHAGRIRRPQIRILLLHAADESKPGLRIELLKHAGIAAN